MKNRKLFISILTGLCACLMSATLLTACKDDHIHSYTEQTVNATCTEKGVTIYTCDCGNVYTEELPALGHDYVPHEAQSPTCTEIGWNTYNTCSRCNYTEYEEIPALLHDAKTHEAKAPTCTEIGWNEYVTCERDGCEYSTHEEIPATGNHTWNSGEITTEPTCTEKGVKTFTCTVCQTATYTEDVPALDHNKVQHNAQAATCTEIGWNAYETCTRCNYTTYVELPALNHDKVQHNAQAATCTEIGWNAYETCTRCNYTTYVEIPALNHDKVQHNAQAATCTEIGWNAYETCSRCDYTTYVELPALTHDKVQHNAQAATCTEKGWNAYETCTRCDYTTYVEIPAFNHDKVQHNAQSATCTEIGWNAYETCTRCDYTTYVELPALNHDKVQHNAQAATCTEIGWNAYETCSRCDYTTYVELPALTHDKVQHNAQAATCTEKGWNAYETCTRCDYTTYVEIPAFNHDKVQHNAQSATCTEIGWNAYETCTRCDYTTYVELPALNHDKVQHNAQAATCTEIGWNAYETCTRCGYTTYVEIPATGHTYSQQNTDEKYLHAEATTESPALYYYSCLCGAKGEETFPYGEAVYVPTESVTLHVEEGILNVGEQGELLAEILPANASDKTLTWTTNNPTVATVVNGVVTAHTEGVATITATTADGKTASCILHVIIPVESVTLNKTEAEIYIGEPFVLTATVYPENATDKTLVWTSSNENVAAVNENGAITARQTGTAVITATAWNGKSATCTLTVKAGEIEFTLTEDSSFYVVTGYKGYDKNVEIPILHDGLRVIRIAEKAFRGNTYIETMTLPNSVQTIDAYAFYECINLKSVNVPESVKELNEYTFANCSNLEKVTLNYKITKISNNAFENCISLKEVVFLTNGTINLEIIDKYAFANCTSLQNFNSMALLPNLTTIGERAFSKCTGLEYVSLPSSLLTISEYAFEYCTGLKLLQIGNPNDEDVSPQATIGKHAFTHCTALEYADLTSIVEIIDDNAFDYCTALKSISLSDTLTKIGNMVFRHAESLVDIQFPSTLVAIGNATFQYCISLQEVILPENITKIGNSAFSYCEGLTDLSIFGDITQWGNSAFYECKKLTSVYIASSSSYDNAEFYEDNYVFYNAGVNGDGITLTIGKTALIPECLFQPVERLENFPKITKIIVEDGATTVKAFKTYNTLPYLTQITLPDTITDITYGIFNVSPWWIAQEKGAVYIDNIFYGYKCDCDYCTPSEIVVENFVDSDCANDGSYQNVVTCTVCGYEVLRQDMVVPAKGHDYIYHEAQAETCTEVGWEEYTACSRCDYTTYVEIPALGHDYIHHEAQAVTCTEIGWEEYNTCSRCDYSTYKEIKATDIHNVENGCCIYCNRKESTQGLAYSQNPDGTYTVTGIGDCMATEIVIDIYNNRSVTAIKSSAFKNCSSLKSVVIGDSVTSIGSSAFYGCSSLTEITIPFVGAGDTYQYPFGYIFGTNSYTGGTATTQYYYGSITSSTTSTKYYIPSSLKSVTITGGNILYGAFSGCSKLTSVTIGDGVTSIGDYAFYNCSSLTSVTIGDSVTSIGSYAFENCSSLKSIVIPDGVTSIGERAFYGCSRLTSITIPDSVTSIGERAFYECSSLTSVVIGNGVTSIGKYAFEDCNSLTSVYITDIAAWCKISFGNSYANPLYYAENLYLNSELVTELIIPDSVTSIGDLAFYNYDSLTSITIPDSVTSIGNYAFYSCNSLTSVTIGDSVTSIGDDAFSGCSSLTSIIIPDSVTSIGDDAFWHCYSLTSITFEATSTWYITTNSSNWENKTGGSKISVTSSSTNATYFKSTYVNYYWYKL